MGKLYRNMLVPVPEGAHVSDSDGRAYIVTEKIYHPEKHYNTDRKMSIGKFSGTFSADNRKLMYPNNNYRFRYPEEFNKYCKDSSLKVPITTKIVGPYAAMLAIAQNNSLYQIMIDSFGPLNANAMMDYAMYSIMEHSNVTKDMKPSMAEYLLFSDQHYSDSWYSDLFHNQMNEAQVSSFKNAWLKHCIDNGIEEVWVCIDGSNDDCDSEHNSYAEHGHGKSGTSGTIVSYMWAVSAKDGTPVSFTVYRGGRVDSKEVLELIEFLKTHGIKVKGFLMDRGFCTDEVIRLMIQYHYNYIILATADTNVYQTMVKKYGWKLKLMKAEYMLDRSGIYGISEEEPVRVFSSHKTEAYATLVYDSANGVARVNALTDKIKGEIRRVNEAVLNGKTPAIEADYKKYIKEAKTADGFLFHSPDIEAIQKATESKGFSCMISSAKLGANQTDSLYTLRQASEKQYSAYKSQLGNDVMRVHSTISWKNKSCVEFIAAILRTVFENTCISLHYDTNQMLKELCQLVITQYPGYGYQYIHTENKRQTSLLSALGISTADLPIVAAEENERLSSEIHSPVHHLPKHDTVRRGPGRPKGSKNLKPKKEKTKKKKGKPGRPKGSKNKKTLAKEAAAESKAKQEN